MPDSGNTPPVGAPVAARDPMDAPGKRRLVGTTIHLRPPDPAADAPSLHAATHGEAETEALWTWMPYGPFPDVAAMQAWMTECAASADPLFRVVADRVTDAPLGMLSWLNIERTHRRLELGHIWYVPSAQRSRVNTEAIHLMLVESFEHLGCRRVEWKCDALNARSRAAALRLGFCFEGIFRHHMIVKGRNRDTAWFALVDADWPAVQANMERWLGGSEAGVSLAALNAPLVRGWFDPAAAGRTGGE